MDPRGSGRRENEPRNFGVGLDSVHRKSSSKESAPLDSNLEEGETETARFQKTRGFASTSGQDYEVALCCLFFLRALRITSDFFLACNHDLAGTFDDVVLFYRLKGDPDLKYRAILLQAKHKDKITKKQLTLSNPFRLVSYLESFKKIKNLWKQAVKVKNREINLQVVSLVLYTNTGCSIGDVALDVTDSSEVQQLQDFLNTGGRLLRILEDYRIGLPRGPETTDFQEHLLLCTEQMSIETADSYLEDELRKVLHLMSPDIANKLNLEFKRVMKDWWSVEGNGHYLTVQSEEWNKVLQIQIARLNSDALIVDRQFNLKFTEIVFEEFDVIKRRMQKTWITVRDEYQATVTRSILLNVLRNCLVLDAKFLDSCLCEVEALWGTAVCPTLAIDMTSVTPEGVSLLQHLQKTVDTYVGRHLIVISAIEPSSAGWAVVELGLTWPLLDPDTQERLLSVQVEFQGNAVELRSLVGSDVTKVMSDEVIKSLCVREQVIKLGEAMPAPLEYYVPRCLQRISSKQINFDTLHNKNILIFSKYISLNSNVNFTNMFKTLFPSDFKLTTQINKTTFVEGVRIDSEIRSLCSQFRVQGISGKLSTTGFESNVTEFIPFTWVCEEKVVVVEGLPGVGKSSFVTTMCSSIKEKYPEAWVLRLDMGSHSNYIKERDFRNSSEIKEFLLMGFPRSQQSLQRNLLEHSLSVTGNVFLFLDAFDEISPDYTTKCCDLLKGVALTVRFRQMVVTTRPVTTKDVEIALQAKAFTLPIFSDAEQTLFLERFLAARGKNVNKDDICSLRQSAGQVLETPLLCKMAAEVLLYRHDQSLLNCRNPWKKVLLYKLFVEQSVNNRLAEKFGLEASMPGIKKLLESNQKQHLQNLQGLAIRKIMSVNQLSTFYVSTETPEEKLGLVVNTGQSLDFEHQTFAEYFCGCWLACHWRQCPQQLLRDLFFNDGNGFVTATMSWSLFEDLPLHLSVAHGNEVAVRELLSSGTSVWTDRGGRTALHVAAMTQGKQREVLELLVASCENVNEKDNVLGSNAVTYAEISANWEFVDLLLEKGVVIGDLNFLTNEKLAEDVIFQIMKEDLTSLCRYILRLNEGIFHQKFDETGNNFLEIAAANNSTGVMEVLIEMRHAMNLEVHNRETPLHEASRYGHMETVRLLIGNVSDANMKNNFGYTPLMLAASSGHLDVVKLLIQNGAETKVKSEHGYTPLILASGNGHMDVVKLLLADGAEANEATDNGYTALIQAASQGHLGVAKLLIENGADPNMNTNNGETALILAAYDGYLKIVQLLIDNKADINRKTEDGNTALILASCLGHQDVVKVLIHTGAETDIKTEDGYTALILACCRGHLQVVKTLIEAGSDLNIKTNKGDTALMLAAREGHLEVVEALVGNGGDPNIKTNKGDTALMLAARRGNETIMNYLLTKGADPNLKNDQGKTAFEYCSEEMLTLLAKT